MTIIIPREAEYEKTRKIIVNSGADTLHILADFDKTLTYAKTKDGRPLHSVISLLRDRDYISAEYQKRAKELFETYHPIEEDPSIPMQKRKEAMKEWWTKHFDLLISSGLNRKDLERIVKSGEIRLRDGFSELASLLQDEGIPLIILSANGIGNVIPMILEREGFLYDNIYIITNLLKFDEQGKAIGVNEPIVHSFNKDETELRGHPSYNKIKNRKNVVLLGDSLGDTEMLKGLKYESCIKIGFLREGLNEQDLESYKKAYDVLLDEDSDLSFVNKLVKEISE
ncbi:MAG: hypothetical protein WC494_00255 [Candidatus Pacearchaeota archaeon]